MGISIMAAWRNNNGGSVKYRRHQWQYHQRNSGQRQNNGNINSGAWHGMGISINGNQ
jgi:hypothetical protein